MLDSGRGQRERVREGERGREGEEEGEKERARGREEGGIKTNKLSL